MSDEMLMNEESLSEVSGGGAKGHTWTENGKLMYRIVRGDTLSQIAKKYDTTARKIQALNKDLIKDIDFIREGWVIRIR